MSPDVICTAQADSLITISGKAFSPVVIDGLTDDPAVEMPRVILIAPDGTETEVPAAGVAIPAGVDDGTALDVTVPMGLVGPGAAGDADVTYDVKVINPNGNEDTLGDALTVVPPPELIAIEPDSGPQGEIVTVTLTGTGFRAGMTVTLDAVPAVQATNVDVQSPITATADFDLTGVAAGTYDVTVTNPDGCSHTLEAAFTVFVPRPFDLTGIDPPFGCTCSTTTVTITANGDFVSTPTVELRPNGFMGPVIELERVAFIDADTITGVVPAGGIVGTYDVRVINPPTDGGIGTLVNGFRVVSMPIPTVEAIVPSRGDPQSDTDVSIFGDNFRADVKVELIDEAGNFDATVTPVTPVDANQIDVTLPTTGMDEGPYLVRVTNLDEDTYSTFSSFLVADTGPSGNLHVFTTSPALNTGRRMLAGVGARDDLGNHYLYAIGGDTGATGDTLDTVEVSQLSKFGALSDWSDIRNKLGTARRGAAAAVVPVFDPAGSQFVPAKSYIYVAGGMSDTGMVLDSVERAVILSSDNAPRVTQISKSAEDGDLEAGTWYYKVSAVLENTDPDNPGGETLPSDEEIITIGGTGGAIDLAWDEVVVNGTAAAEYRIYRTDAVNGASSTEHLIATTSDTSFTDTGENPGTEEPLPPGSTGVWVTLTETLNEARWGHQVATVADANGDRTLMVVGGKLDNADGYIGSVEYAEITDTDGDIGGFLTAGVNAMTARAFFSLALETPQSVSGFTGGTRLFALGGVDAGGASDLIEQSDVATGGGNGTWTAYGGAGSLQTRAGVMAVITSDKLFAMGGSGAATDTTFGSPSANGRDVPFLGNGDIGSPIQAAAQDLPAARTLGVALTRTGFIYFIGGSSDGADAVDTVYRTF